MRLSRACTGVRRVNSVAGGTMNHYGPDDAAASAWHLALRSRPLASLCSVTPCAAAAP